MVVITGINPILNNIPVMINKVNNPFCILLGCFIIFSTFKSNILAAQDTASSPLKIINTREKYKSLVKQDAAQKMVELKTLIPGIVYDLRYATFNNFMHREMYPHGTKDAFLRMPVAQQLLLVQKELNQQGLGLKIFDAYRPYAVTVKFWELVHDERYVANPAKGSGHNRGIAVDLTIIHLNNKTELDLGTGFDNFTDTAHQSFQQLSPAILENRKLLRTIMEKYGFKALETEWWHYYLPPPERFDVLDLKFSEIRNKK